jgi:hypothetical protein
MPSNSDASITLKARTDEFNARLNKAVGTFETLASKGKDVSKSLDSSFKNIAVVAKDSAFQIEKSFNALSIKSDLSLDVQARALEQNVKFFERQYQKIAKDANTSAAESVRAFQAMNNKIRQLNEQPLKSSFSTLGIIPTSTIEADKAKAIAAFNAIKASGTASASDVRRAYQAMNVELARLKKLGSVNPVEKTTNGINLMSIASAAAIVKIQILYSLVNTTMSLIGSIPGVAVDAIESFNSASISSAAIITSMQKGVTDIGKAYQDNKKYAVAVQEVLVKMDAQTAASGKNLTDMNQKFVQQGVLIDTNNQKQIDGYLNIANALAALTANDANSNLQYSQEIASLLRGEDRASNKLFQTLNALDNGQLKEHLKLWKETAQETGNYGLILEKLGPLLAGFGEAQKDINLLWVTQKSTLATIRDEILRDGFGPQFELIVEKLKEINEYATENKDAIANMIKGGFENANEVIDFVGKYKKEIVLLTGVLVAAKAAQLLLNIAITKNPYAIAIAALVGLNELAEKFEIGLNSAKPNETVSAIAALLDAANAKEVVKQLSERERITAKIAELQGQLAGDKKWYEFSVFKDPNEEKRRIDEISAKITELKNKLIELNSASVNNLNLLEFRDTKRSSVGSEVIKVPNNVKFGGETDDEAAQKLRDKQLKLETKLKEKLLELEKSFNELALAANANARKFDLEQAKIANDEKIISLSAYIAKKQAIEVAAAQEEIKINQDAVNAFKKVLDGKFSEGTRGEIERTEARIKFNKATKDLQDSEAQLALITTKNAAERSKYNREEEDFVRDYQLKYAEFVNNFEEAERIRQSSLSYTTELWRLEQDAIEGVAGAQEALAKFQQTGQVNIKLASNKDQFKKQDSAFDALGSSGDNQFDSISSKYVDMYRKIKDSEDKFGKESLEAQNLRWGSQIDMVRDSTSMITGLLMKGNREQFEAGKALAVAMAVMNASLSVSKALTLTYPMNFVVAGLVGAAAAIEVSTIMSQQYEGRANGGPVIAGQTYIVNENRRTEGPEYFTPGVNGYITPARNVRDGQADDYIPNRAVANGNVNVIVNNYGDSDASVNKKDDGNGTIDIEVIIDAMNGRNLVKKGSASNKAIESLRGPQLIRR